MKKLVLIAFIAISCNKAKNAPSNKSTSAGTVWCINSYTTFLECNSTSEQSALTKAQWYRDNNYTMITVTKKGNCSECQ